ncbi:MAG: phosphatase PAP2 family protein [Solitalea-like symbiont of Acarus siro]
MEFSTYFQLVWTNVFLYFGYSCYFIIIILVHVIFYYKRPQSVSRVLFIIITSFYTYYLIYCLVPIIGPKFFFSSPYNYVSKNGFFPYIVGILQNTEMPTGAFPSSHVGVTLILLIICHKYKIKLFYCLIPIFTIIIFATVYIKAHYAIDVIAGIISAFFVYKISASLYNILS